jgi:surfeit locus 1 family protein
VITLLAPRYWGAHLAMVLAVAIATGLGFWQLQAWHDRREAEAKSLVNAAPVTLRSVMGGDSPFPGNYVSQPVTFSGSWLAKGTVYVSGRQRDGRSGYWVMTPLLVDGTKSAMPVVRGWSAKPDAPAATGTVKVDGWLQPGEGSGLPDADPEDDVIPEARVASIVQFVDADLYSGYVIARTVTGSTAGVSATAGLGDVHPTQAPAVGQTTALRNFLYAIEWWVFGLFALVIWGRWCRDTLHPPPPEDTSEPRSEDPPADPSADQPGTLPLEDAVAER